MYTYEHTISFLAFITANNWILQIRLDLLFMAKVMLVMYGNKLVSGLRYDDQKRHTVTKFLLNFIKRKLLWSLHFSNRQILVNCKSLQKHNVYFDRHCFLYEWLFYFVISTIVTELISICAKFLKYLFECFRNCHYKLFPTEIYHNFIFQLVCSYLCNDCDFPVMQIYSLVFSRWGIIIFTYIYMILFTYIQNILSYLFKNGLSLFYLFVTLL